MAKGLKGGYRRFNYMLMSALLVFSAVVGFLHPKQADALNTWVGEYWNLDSPTDRPDFPETAPDLTRTDNQVQYSWDSSSPDDSINIDGFMARWTSSQTFDSGYYKFNTTSDDGVRVYLDGTKIIDNWLTGNNWDGHTAAELTAGSHEIVVEYYENTGSASIYFTYEKVAIADGLTTTDITDCEGLQAMANDLTGNYRLANNIDCSDTGAWNGGEGFVPVGDMDNYFQGTLDGNDKAISNLVINLPDSGLPVGLFGAAGASSMVQDLYIANATITGATNVGTLAGYLAGTAVGVHSTGSVTGETPPTIGSYGIGGLVGTHAAEPGPSYTIIGSSSSANVNAVNAEESYAGGLVGQNVGKDIFFSYASGTVEGLSSTGGLVGYSNLASIGGSHATGSVTSFRSVGGLVGFSDHDSISDSYASGAVSTVAGYAGGLIGDASSSEIKQVWATGAVSGTGTGTLDRVGGLIGVDSAGTLSYAYATGDVNIGGTGLVGEAGGLIGVADEVLIDNVYATGDVAIDSSDTYGDTGGLIGYITGAYTLNRAFATGNVSMTGSAASAYVGNGGLIGFDSGSEGSYINQTFATGNVTNGNYAGGLIGTIYNSNGSVVMNSYARGNVSGTEAVASLIGEVELGNDYTYTTVQTSYATGVPTPLSGASVGSIYGLLNITGVGANLYSYDVFWDEDTTGITDLSDYGYGFPTTEMKNIRTYTDFTYNTDLSDGYDFTGTQYDDAETFDYWAIDGVTNDGYPYLGMTSDLNTDFDFSWFTNSDSDIAVDSVENSGRNSGDSNDDGTQDSNQGYVIGYKNVVSGGSTVLELVGNCTILSVGTEAESAQTAADSGYSYPEGLMRFTAECPEDEFGNSQTVTVNQYFYGLSSDGVIARKYNSDTGTYSTISGATISELTIDGRTVTKISYQVTDGLELDEDGAYNGIIIDPSGPGLNNVGTPNTGLMRLFKSKNTQRY